MPTVEVLTFDEIAARREQLLDSVRMSEEELRAKAADYALGAHEIGILLELDGLDYLLGNESGGL